MSRFKENQSGGRSVRLLRVGESVRHALSQILMRGDVQDDDLIKTPVTVTEVKVSPDLRNATVYFLPLGGEKKDVIKAALKRNSAYIRGQLAKAVHMKYLPALRFELDPSFDEAGKVNDLLASAHVRQDISPAQKAPDGDEEE